MQDVLLLLVGVAIFVLLYNFTWYIIEWIHPLEYHDLSFREIQNHIEEFQRRGYRGSQMIVVDDRSGAAIRVRKFFAVSKAAIDLDVIADQVGPGDHILPSALSALRDLGIQWRWGIPHERVGLFGQSRRRFANNMVCPCGDNPNLAVKVIEVIFTELYGLPEDIRLKIRVKGTINAYEQVVHGRMTWSEAGAYAPLAKPYKQFQKKGGLFYWSGRLVGSVCREIRNMLFPPRGPDGRLGL